MKISNRKINEKLKIISAKNIHNKNRRLWLRQKEIKNTFISELLIQKRNNYYSIDDSNKYRNQIVSKLAKQFNTTNNYIRKILFFTLV